MVLQKPTVIAWLAPRPAFATAGSEDPVAWLSPRPKARAGGGVAAGTFVGRVGRAGQFASGNESNEVAPAFTGGVGSQTLCSWDGGVRLDFSVSNAFVTFLASS